jgi:hypothetical protein
MNLALLILTLVPLVLSGPLLAKRGIIDQYGSPTLSGYMRQVGKKYFEKAVHKKATKDGLNSFKKFHKKAHEETVPDIWEDMVLLDDGDMMVQCLSFVGVAQRVVCQDQQKADHPSQSSQEQQAILRMTSSPSLRSALHEYMHARIHHYQQHRK